MVSIWQFSLAGARSPSLRRERRYSLSFRPVNSFSLNPRFRRSVISRTWSLYRALTRLSRYSIREISLPFGCRIDYELRELILWSSSPEVSYTMEETQGERMGVGIVNTLSLYNHVLRTVTGIATLPRASTTRRMMNSLPWNRFRWSD